jgi:hypothetical protein
MLATYNQLKGNEDFPINQFRDSVQSLYNAFLDNYSSVSEWIPFNTSCCAVKDIGAQADYVTGQMLKSVGAAPLGPGPGTTPPPIDAGSIMSLIMVVVGAVVLGQLAPLLKR